MKLTTGILLLAVSAGAAWAQTPNILQNTKDKLNGAQQQRVAQENAALGGSQAAAKPAPAGKPAAKSPSLVVKPVAQAAAPKSAVQVKPVTAKPAAQPVAASSKPTVKAEPKGAVQPSSANKNAQAAAKPAVSKTPPTKISVAPVAPQPKQGAQKTAKNPFKPATQKQAKPVDSKKQEAKSASKAVSTDSVVAEPPKEKKTITAEGRRDPFISPVISRASGPSCSVGKRCLAIDQITVRGVVKSENGMIAVVVNSLNKAYFLKENDPVYNGYVVKITGDSVVFKETVQDRLGKESTREVVKKITTPAV